VNCTITQQISLNQNGSADIKPSPDVDNQVESGFYKSNEIYNLKESKQCISFSIKTIDSLGNYLSPALNKNIFQFRYTQDTLFIIQQEGKVFTDINCNLFIVITSERKIKYIQTQNSSVKLKKGNKIVIGKSRRSFKKREKNLRVVVVFDK
jgi:hypothetical protein